MNAWGSKKKRSIFIILLVIFIAIIIPLYIIGFGIYSWGYSMTKEEITNSLNASVDFYMGTLESEISRIRSLQYECLNDENLFYFINASGIMTDYEKVSALLSLQARLSVMKNSSSYIKNVTVYIPGIGKTISAEGGVVDLTDGWKNTLAAKADNSEAGIIYASGSLYLLAAYPSTMVSADQTPLYILIIELSTNDMQSRLLSFNHYPNSGAMLVNKPQGFRLVGGISGGVADIVSKCGFSIDTLAKNKSVVVSADGSRYILVGKQSSYLNMGLYTYVPEQSIYGGIQRYQLLFLFFSLAALIIVVAFAFSAYRLIQRPMVKLVRSLTKVEKGVLSVRITHSANDEFGYLYSAFNNMAESLENLIEQNYKQKILTQRAEMRQLQAQINPHFLYNSFFILYRMAKDEDYENITAFLQYLAEYYRFITRDVQAEVTLENEVAHARNYTNIQLMRFSRRIEASFAELPECFRNMPVPRLILQPLIENAFEHGLKDVQVGGLLKVDFAEIADGLAVTVEDNGQCLADEEIEVMQKSLDADGGSAESTGIVNIHRRLKLYFGEKSGLTLRRGASGGLEVRVTLSSWRREDV